MKVYEFWPSDFLHIFRQAGISLKTPPAYGEDCSLDQKSASGQYPVLLSPQRNVEYVIQNDDPMPNQIPFSATVDPDVATLFWFVNDRFVGSGPAKKTFFWQATSGKFMLRVVDDSGRLISSSFRVLLFNHVATPL